MKIKSLLLSICLCGSLFAADAQMPSEVRLANGVVLKKVSVVRWTKDAVVLKHQSGIDPVQFANIHAEDKAKLMAVRDATPTPAKAVPVPQVVEKRTIAGQVFAKGQNQPYVFAGAKVLILDRAEALGAFAIIGPTTLPTAKAVVMTDVKGSFEVSLPAGDYYVYCLAKRDYGNNTQGDYEWRIDLPKETDASRLILSGENASFKPSVEARMIRISR